MATVNRFFVTLNAVRLIPFNAMEPFSITRVAKFSGKPISSSQLPFLSFTAMQVPVVSTWPCTKWPSSRLLSARQRSRFTSVSGTQFRRFVFLRTAKIGKLPETQTIYQVRSKLYFASFFSFYRCKLFIPCDLYQPP